MYIPKHFQISDPQQLAAFIQAHSFGLLFSQTDGEPFATHLPFILDKDERGEYLLLGHMARVNPHWQLINGQVLVVFQGPHAYISPAWYQEEHTVPTWNYTAVHVYGEFIPVVDGAELTHILHETIDTYESARPQPWTTDLSSAFNHSLSQMIVAFKIKITRMEGKWKLSQNHSAARRTKAIAGLRSTNDYQANQVADLMAQTLPEDH